MVPRSPAARARRSISAACRARPLTGSSLVFTVANQGNGPLNLGTPTVPSGFTLLDAPPATIAAGASDTFTLQMNTVTAGAISGAFSLPTNDYGTSGLTQGLFNFTLTGIVTAPPTNPVLVPGTGFTGAHRAARPRLVTHRAQGYADNAIAPLGRRAVSDLHRYL